MSLEERALEILREHEEEEEEEEQVHAMSPRADLDTIHDERDSDGDDDGLDSELKEHPEAPLSVLERSNVEDPDDDEDEDEDEDDLYRLLEVRTRYTEPLKGSPYVKKHDDILIMEPVTCLYYMNEK